jgi:hypothetical protein
LANQIGVSLHCYQLVIHECNFPLAWWEAKYWCLTFLLRPTSLQVYTSHKSCGTFSAFLWIVLKFIIYAKIYMLWMILN